MPFVVGVSWGAVGLALGLYIVRMFGITAGYHRYFAHRAFKAPRWFQFVLAWLGASSLQKGPLWWAGHHRTHHRWSDTPRDLHSPLQRGFWYSHMGWFFSPEHDATEHALIPDFAKYAELRWLDRYHWVPAAVMALGCYALDGARGLVWGMGVSTVLLWHGTFFINSLAHVWGSRRYETADTSRNNLVLALITLGEGWHNNHHHYMNSVNQGFFWYEIDLSYYALRALSWVKITRDLRMPPAHVLRDKLVSQATEAAARLTEARLAAEAKLEGARIAAREVVVEAEAKLEGARIAAEARLEGARIAAREAVVEAEARIAEVREAVEEAVDAADGAVKPVG
ncbi:MAG: fatty acid desaturase [Myxococcales bacterium]|nr:fatty acid desaturase [Myxococcales bacterium]